VASEPIGDENRWEVVPDGATLLLDPAFNLTVRAPPPGWTAPEIPAAWRTFCDTHGIRQTA
jgi:hypothetical protein